MRRRAMLVMGLVAMLDGTPAEARLRTVGCCVMVPAPDTQEMRPYCFNLRVRRVRLGRRICRALDGDVRRLVVR